MPSGDPSSTAARLHEASLVLTRVDELIGTGTLQRVRDSLRTPEDPARCELALDDAHHALVTRLADPACARRELVADLLLRIGNVRAAAREATAAAHRALLPSIAGMMSRFREATTTAELLADAPRQIVTMGYDRCLVSRVHEGRWIAESSYVRGDAELAEAITLAGSESPARLDRRLLETELVHTRAPMLVRDAQRNPRVHRRLIDVTASTAYVAAPVQVGSSVAGFVHVDRTARPALVDDDLELVGLVAECLGYALERTIHRERLQALRASLSSWSSSTLALLDDGGAGEPGAPSAGPDVEVRRVDLDRLTHRERQVLGRIASGESNTEIAGSLFITHATVKAHVKHIFRKLGVANRAEAVSTYLRGAAP